MIKSLSCDFSTKTNTIMANLQNQEFSVDAISGGLENVLKGVIELSKIWIRRISDDYSRATLLDLAETFKQVVTAVADENPRDHEQIRQIVDNFLSDSGFVDRTKEELVKKIDQLQDPRLKVVMLALLPVAFDLIKILFDDEKPNEDQVVARLKELISSPDAVDVLTALLSYWVKDEATARTIARLILSIYPQYFGWAYQTGQSKEEAQR